MDQLGAFRGITFALLTLTVNVRFRDHYFSCHDDGEIRHGNANTTDRSVVGIVCLARPCNCGSGLRRCE